MVWGGGGGGKIVVGKDPFCTILILHIVNLCGLFTDLDKDGMYTRVTK